MASRVLKLRRPDVCCVCGAALPAGSRAGWDAEARTVTCATCLEAAVPVAADATQSGLDRGQPGASLAREYERRKNNRESRTRARPIRGSSAGCRSRCASRPEHESAFHRGDFGREGGRAITGTAHRGRAGDHPAQSPHTRRTRRYRPPRRRPNRRVRHRRQGHKGSGARSQTPVQGREVFLVSGRDRTKLIHGLDRQCHGRRELNALDDNGHPDVPVQGIFRDTFRPRPAIISKDESFADSLPRSADQRPRLPQEAEVG